MELVRLCLVAILLVAISCGTPMTALAQEKAADDAKIVGTWRGESLCVDKSGSCHDEVAIYRIAAIAGKLDVLLVSGGKMVDGKEIVMGKSLRPGEKHSERGLTEGHDHSEARREHTERNVRARGQERASQDYAKEGRVSRTL